jgi:hypothetical protein
MIVFEGKGEEQKKRGEEGNGRWGRLGRGEEEKSINRRRGKYSIR